jgi:hypothetical protein
MSVAFQAVKILKNWLLMFLSWKAVRCVEGLEKTFSLRSPGPYRKNENGESKKISGLPGEG